LKEVCDRWEEGSDKATEQQSCDLQHPPAAPPFGRISHQGHVCIFPRRRKTRFCDFNDKIWNLVLVQPSYEGIPMMIAQTDLRSE
jgi:hypothetical protein